MKRFESKVALVTGGGTGMGRAAAIQLAAEGAKVVIGNRNEEAGQATVRAIEDAGGLASFLKTDVANADQVQTLVDHAVVKYGGLHAAFNNAGIEGTTNPLADSSDDEFDRVMTVNVKGVYLCMKSQIPAMLASGGGSIVNNSSIAGLNGFPGQAIYAASKHAVNGLTKSAALEYGALGVRVNSVCPAVIDTPMFDRFNETLGMPEEQLIAMHPIGRIGKSEEVAHLACWLLSDEASFMLGQTIAVDGGATAI